MRTAFFFGLTALGVAAAALYADEPRRIGADNEKFTDNMFLQKAAVGGIFEVKSSELAERMGQTSAIRDFAARMVADHTKANGELANLAQRKGWTIPTAVDKKHQEMLDQLSRAQSGNQFDRLYVDDQLKAHEKTVALFERAGQDAQDRDLKAWATQTLPTLKEHERLVKRLSTHGTGPAASTTVPPATRTRPPK